jgi:hypothetical protein
VGDNATLVIGDGVNVATMHVGYLQASSSGGVATININTNGTLTADDGHIYGPGTSVNLLGGTFRVKNKAGGTEADIPELDGIFGRGGLPIACGGVIVDTTSESGYTIYTANTTDNELPTITAAIDPDLDYKLLYLNGDPNTFALSAIVTDLDGFDNHTYTWSVLDAPEDANAVTFDPNDSLVTAVTFNVVGNYILEVTVNDNDGTENGRFCVHDTVNFYVDGCAAAKGEGETPYDKTWADSIGDRNYDCEVNLVDFADMASTWLNDEANLDDLADMAFNWLTNKSL